MKPAVNVTVAQILQRELAARGWTAADVAARSELREETVTAFLNGHRTMTAFVAAQLARAFGTSADLWIALGVAEFACLQ